MIEINLLQGITDNPEYKAFKFPGGEIHLLFKQNFSEIEGDFYIKCRLNNSDDFMFLLLAVETLKKDWPEKYVSVYIPYMLYQQADRDFSIGEVFSLAVIVKLLAAIPVDHYIIFDPHSENTAGMIKVAGKKVTVIDNSEYIKQVVAELPSHLILLSPDSGAYKKIYKLADKIKFKGEVVAANKSRSISTGNIDSI